jgi:hypothetical protein
VSTGPPPLRPFGLCLHHDGRWTHEGHPITHVRLRAAFDRGVRFLPEEGKYVVQLGRFRGEIEVEEAGFFVRDVDLETGEIALSDATREGLELMSLRPSLRDSALLCTVKRDLLPEGLPARFTHSAQSALLVAIEETPAGFALRIAGQVRHLPDLA